MTPFRIVLFVIFFYQLEMRRYLAKKSPKSLSQLHAGLHANMLKGHQTHSKSPLPIVVQGQPWIGLGQLLASFGVILILDGDHLQLILLR